MLWGEPLLSSLVITLQRWCRVASRRGFEPLMTICGPLIGGILFKSASTGPPHPRLSSKNLRKGLPKLQRNVRAYLIANADWHAKSRAGRMPSTLLDVPVDPQSGARSSVWEGPPLPWVKRHRYTTLVYPECRSGWPLHAGTIDSIRNSKRYYLLELYNITLYNVL